MDETEKSVTAAPRPLSLAQLPIWRAEVLRRGTPRWTQITTIRLQGAVDVDRLEGAIGRIVARHPALRTRLQRNGSRVSQIFAPTKGFQLTRYNQPTARPEQATVIAKFVSAAQQDKFDFYGGVLFRADLLALAEDEFVLLLCLHHIAADGVALGLIVPQIATAYREQYGETRPDRAYEDWLDRQHEAPPTGVAAAAAYYRQTLDGAILHSAKIYDQPEDGELREAPHLLEATITLNAELSNALRALARERGGTLFIVLFAAYAAMLWVFAAQSDLVVATFVSGRAGERVPIVGSCINTVLVRVRLGAEEAAGALIDAVKEAWRPVRRHQAVPSVLLSGANQASLPLAQFAINFLDMNDAAFDVPGLASSVTHAQQGFPLNDVLFYALREQDDRLRLRLIAGSGTSGLSKARLDDMLNALVHQLQEWTRG